MSSILRLLPLWAIIFLGSIGVAVFSYYALIDWNALQQTYVNFSNIAQNSPNVTTLLAAEAQQNIHRINLFAEGVWTLQSAIFTAIGLHGIVTFSQNRK